MTPAPADLRPVAVSVDTPERFAAWRALEGLPPDQLACVPGIAGTNLVCLRVWERATRRWVLTSDLAAWGTTAEALLRTVADQGPQGLARAELVPVEGSTDTYLRLVDPDWAAVAFLRPDLVVARLGGGAVRVAVPEDRVLLAWRADPPGEVSELDRVMAVGVHEWFTAGASPVSPWVFTWDGQTWTPFVRAVPRP